MPWEGGTQAPGPIRGSGLACSGPNRVGRLMPAWCVGCLWTRVGWGEIQPLMPTLGLVWFTVKNIFSLVCPLSPLLRWERGEGEKVRINGPHRPQRPRSVWPCSLPHPPGHLLPVGILSPPYFSLMGGLEKLERSSGCEGHSGKPQSLPGPSFKPQLPPTLYRPALHPTCSDTCGRFSMGTTINNSRCPGSGLAGVQTKLSVNGLEGSIPHPPGLPITGP